ncbi:MAG: hypothetical protein KA248_15345 [Kiritimatiellae bacterium]|nr:hypothetical protein [Kiritimatiellia bacterium]
MAEQPTETPAPEKVDLAQLKQMLKLPETATETDIIAALVQLIAGLQQKYDALQQKYNELLGDAVAMEDEVANRYLADFEDLIPNERREFWKSSLLHNRDETLGILLGLRKVRDEAKPAPATEPKPEAKPLFRNRLVVARTVSELAEESPAASISRAVAIRNRAHQIRSTEKIPYALAFSRAEREIEQ